MAKKYALDIFDVLKRLNSKNSGDVYASFSETEKKGASPLVIARWMTGTSDERQIMMINEFVNPAIFTLSNHPHLLFQMLQIASSKTNKHFQWLGIKSKKKNVETMKTIAAYYDMSLREVGLLNPLPTNDEILQMGEELGYQKDEMTKLKAELK